MMTVHRNGLRLAGVTLVHMPRVIGLSGKKRHGKDTLGAQLVAEGGYRRVAFADALYREVSELTGVSVSVLQDAANKERAMRELGGKSPRQFLQEHGMRRREDDEDHWVNQVDNMVCGEPQARFVITDVRLPNEARWAERHGILVRVMRPGCPATDTHISEMALDDWPFQYKVLNVEGQSQKMLSSLLAMLERAQTEAFCG